MQENLIHIIESLLFVSEDPLTVEKLKNILETVDAKEIRVALNSLAEQYDSRGGGFKLAEVAGGWQLRSRPEYNEWIKRMLQPPPQRLSKAALETLAIVAYNQPIIRADLEHIRGVDSGGVLRQLLEKKLIRVLGRKEIPGRPLIYATTKLFLELFELKDLKDLPSPKEIEEMSAAAEEAEGGTETSQEEPPLFAVMDSESTVQAESLPRMRFTMAADQSIPADSGPDKRPSTMAAIRRPVAYSRSGVGRGFSVALSSMPAGRPSIRPTPSILPKGDIGRLPGSV